MRRLFFFCGLIAIGRLGFLITDRDRARDALHAICELSAAHFYRDTTRFRAWLARCRATAAALPRGLTSGDVLARAQALMDELGVSHFNTFAPAEDRKLWTGRAVHTGILSRYVDGFLIIHRVIEGSAADRAGARAGDEIVRLPGIDEVSPAGATFRAGEYRLRRGARDFSVRLTPTPVVISGAPRVEDLGDSIRLARVPSFRAEYFGPEDLGRLARALASARGVVIDLRENSGGNFAAMLRLLSVFTCGPARVGRLVAERHAAGAVGTLADDLSDAAQIEQLAGVRELELVTPSGYGCVRAPVIALVGPDTSSVAEIFADALAIHPSARVWGWPTAGDVVLAIWYPLRALGVDFSVSIPQAAFVDERGRELEGRGVEPSRTLHHDLARARAGEDAWISAATRALR